MRTVPESAKAPSGVRQLRGVLVLCRWDSGRDRRAVHCAPVASSVRVWQVNAGHPLMVRHIVGDHALTLRSFARIGHYVMPRVRDR